MLSHVHINLYHSVPYLSIYLSISFCSYQFISLCCLSIYLSILWVIVSKGLYEVNQSQWIYFTVRIIFFFPVRPKLLGKCRPKEALITDVIFGFNQSDHSVSHVGHFRTKNTTKDRTMHLIKSKRKWFTFTFFWKKRKKEIIIFHISQCFSFLYNFRFFPSFSSFYFGNITFVLV